MSEGGGGGVEVEDPAIYLDEGDVVPVKLGDDTTANGLELWADQPPLYHDLNFASYLHFDVQEWTSRIKKYKYEVVSHAERIRRLMPQVKEMRNKLESHTEDFGELDATIKEAAESCERLVAATAAEKQRRNQLQTELNSLKKHREVAQKSIEMVKAESASCLLRIGLLKEEVDGNRRRFEYALGEKEKLNLERQWFFRERLLLEETTALENQDAATLLESVEKLRHTMHRAWKEAKSTDVLGHLRATKLTAADEAWYAARRRTFVREKTSNSSTGSTYTMKPEEPEEYDPIRAAAVQG